LIVEKNFEYPKSTNEKKLEQERAASVKLVSKYAQTVSTKVYDP
jgi:hypothetical protein